MALWRVRPSPNLPTRSTPTPCAMQWRRLWQPMDTERLDLLGSGTWTQEGTALRIEVAGMGKKMIALTVNTAAERIIRQELQKLGADTLHGGSGRGWHGFERWTHNGRGTRWQRAGGGAR